MDERKTYTPPTAEIILLAPEEKLAAWDWSFDIWKHGYIAPSENQVASAVGIINGTGVLNDDKNWTGDGFVIKR